MSLLDDAAGLSKLPFESAEVPFDAACGLRGGDPGAMFEFGWEDGAGGASFKSLIEAADAPELPFKVDSVDDGGDVEEDGAGVTVGSSGLLLGGSSLPALPEPDASELRLRKINVSKIR